MIYKYDWKDPSGCYSVEEGPTELGGPGGRPPQQIMWEMKNARIRYEQWGEKDMAGSETCFGGRTDSTR